ncbi:MAG: alpha/beta hydrolase [Myxococcota bacterium]|nr:alpha/beta hydrolase [Myxococcota bacterium]
MSDATEMSFRSPSGLQLHASAWGDPRNPLVLMLHGGGQTRHAWLKTALVLAQNGYYAVAPDGRGHGDSDWDSNGNYSIEVFRDDLAHWVEYLGSPAPTLVGASLGGFTSLLYEGLFEGPHCRALVLVDMAPTVQPKGVQRVVDFMKASPDGFVSLEEAADAIAAYLPHRKRPSDLSGLSKNLRQGPDGRYRWHWDPQFIVGKGDEKPEEEGIALRNQLIHSAQSLVVPTLLVRGKLSDVVSREDVDRLLSYAPHAEFVDISDAGHMVTGDSNDPFSQAIVDFLVRHVPQKAT